MKSYVPITIVILCLLFLISSLQYSNMVSQVVVQGQEEDDGDTEEEVVDDDGDTEEEVVDDDGDTEEEVVDDDGDTEEEVVDDGVTLLDDNTLDDDNTLLDDDTQVQPANDTQRQALDDATELQPANATELQPANATELQPANATELQPANATQVGPCAECVVSNSMISSFITSDGQRHDTVVSKPLFEAEGDKTRLSFGISNLPKGKSGDLTLKVPHSYFSNITGASVGGKEVDIMVEGDPTITISLEDTDEQEELQIVGVRAPEKPTNSGNYRISYNWVPLRQDLSQAILLDFDEAPHHALTVTFWNSHQNSTVISSGKFNLTIRHADLDRDDRDEFRTISNLYIKDDGSSGPLEIDFTKDIDEIPNEYDVEVTLTEVDGETLGRPDNAVLQRVRVVP
jgi:hypothetical protein